MKLQTRQQSTIHVAEQIINQTSIETYYRKLFKLTSGQKMLKSMLLVLLITDLSWLFTLDLHPTGKERNKRNEKKFPME